jgi:hypothetical protein
LSFINRVGLKVIEYGIRRSTLYCRLQW